MPESALIFLRHGHTDYGDTFPGLTLNGIEQIRKTAEEMREIILSFDKLVIYSSPATRALGSAHVFSEQLGIYVPIDQVSDLAPFEIKDREGFLEYDRQHSDARKYGRMWLADAFLGEENPLVESRRSVEARFKRFMSIYPERIAQVAQDTGMSTCALISTHFEIGNYALHALHCDSPTFPLDTEDVLGYAETVVLRHIDPPHHYLVEARKRRREVAFNPITGLFEPKGGII